MTVSAAAAKVDYAGDGAEVEFEISFEFQNKNQLEVITRVTATGVETLWVEGAGYEVNGIDVVLGIPGTDIEFDTAPATGVEIHIRRKTPMSQATSLTNGVTTPQETFETTYDKQTMIMQELDEKIARAALLSKTTPETAITLAEPVAGEFLKWNAGGTGIDSTDVLTGVAADLAGVADGDMLVYDDTSGEFVATDPDDLGIAIGSLSPVDITSAATGDVLRFNGTDWVDYPDSNYAAAATLTTHVADTAAPHGAASANTASRIVTRDASGNFAAGTITATLTGNVTGNVTGNASGTAATFTGNLTGDVTSVGMATAIGSGVIVDGDINGSAGITRSKTASGTNYRILANNATGVMSENAALTANTVVTADANGQLTGVAPGSSGNVLTSNGTVWASAAPTAPSAALSIVSKTANHTVLTTEELILCDATSGAFTITTYTAVGNTGRIIRILKTDSSANRITVDANSTETIGGSTVNRLIGIQNDDMIIVSDGTNWQVLKCETITARYYSSTTTVSGANATIVYATLDNDSSSSYNNTTGVFTVKVAGRYRVYAGLIMGGSFTVDNNCQILVRRNVTEFGDTLVRIDRTGTGSRSVTVSDEIVCAVGDTIDIRALNEASSPVIAASNNFNYVTFSRIGN
jgi:hypothetical protein